MSEMPDDWGHEFAKRARENLCLVRKKGQNEVTQTILTLYAIVVLPYEHNLFESIEDQSKEAMQNDGWPLEGWSWQIKKKKATPKIGRQAFFKMLRNALAHGDFSFESEGGIIVAICFDHKCDTKDWDNSMEGRWTTDQALRATRKILKLIGQ